ncbi:MAG: aldo/keto reductase [Candidatus Hodarchaeales archaeon]|jgi:diketogulonate reductase-like aldo/keto reductase
MSLDMKSSVTLNNGINMPLFGLGLYRTKTGQETQDAVKWAYEANYHHFDTAQIYQNEKDVGKALKELKIVRDENFITTKIWNANHGERTRLSFDKSLEKLHLDYVDLLLMHWPVKDKRLETWEEMIKILDSGKARAIGVSNFMTWHLEELLDHTSVIPAVNQVEFSPFLYDKKLHEYCVSKNIQLEGYSPLTKGRKLNEPKLVGIAKKYNKTPAQLLIRWPLQHNIVVIPKSSKKDRIIQNSEIFDFEISSEDLEKMNTWNIDLVTGWNPRDQD